MVGFILWLLLLVFCWPLALLALVLWPLVWLLTLPLRLVGIAVEGAFALLRALVLLPARVLGRPALSLQSESALRSRSSAARPRAS